VNPQIEKLLILQDRDTHLKRIQSSLGFIPAEIERHEAAIAAEKQVLEDAKSTYRRMEVDRKDLENRISAGREQVLKFRNQQMQVKKNDEYQALTKEIEQTEAQVSSWEDQEIELMLGIDEESEKVKGHEEKIDGNIAAIQQKIDVQLERKSGLEAQLAEAQSAYDEAKAGTDAAAFAVYDRLAQRMTLPVVVAVEAQKCGGCHLKISNDVEAQIRSGERLTTCDNCGRLVYLAS